MVIKEVNSVLEEIKSIKNIRSIKIYDLINYKNSDSRKYILPGMIVVYHGDKGNNCINLCAKDEYFSEYVRQVQKVYEKESKESGTTFFESSYISIDDNTKKVLEELNISKKHRFIEGNSYSESLSFELEEVTAFIPLIKYHLGRLIDKTDLVLKFSNDKVEGYHTYYTVDATVNGVIDRLLIKFSKDDDFYNVTIRSINKSFPKVEETIKISTSGIDVTSKLENITLENKYDFVNNVSYSEDLYVNGLRIASNKEEVGETTSKYENIASLNGDVNGKWYYLPWDAYFIFNEEIESITNKSNVSKRDTKYLCVSNGNFILIDDHTKRYFATKENGVVANTMELDSDSIRTIGFKNNNGIYILESKIDDKYYYEATSEELDGISNDRLISVNRDLDVITKGDLSNDIFVKKVGGNI